MVGEMGVHRGRSHRLVTWPVHDHREARQARRAGADAAFVSPVFATRSHPGAPSLGKAGSMRLARTLPMVRVALGGMDALISAEPACVSLPRGGRDQKRKAVPT